MNYLKLAAVAALSVSAGSLALGQADPQATPEGGAAHVESARDRIDNFLAEKGWGLGPNKGGKFFVRPR